MSDEQPTASEQTTEMFGEPTDPADPPRSWAAGKHPVVVKDTAMAWGYVANRVYSAMIREAQRVIDEGIADRGQIDQLMVDCFRWPAGPFGMVRGAGSGWS